MLDPVGDIWTISLPAVSRIFPIGTHHYSYLMDGLLGFVAIPLVISAMLCCISGCGYDFHFASLCAEKNSRFYDKVLINPNISWRLPGRF